MSDLVRSCRPGGEEPQPLDPPEDGSEERAGDRHLRHLEHHPAGVVDHFGARLDEFVPQSRRAGIEPSKPSFNASLRASPIGWAFNGRGEVMETPYIAASNACRFYQTQKVIWEMWVRTCFRKVKGRFVGPDALVLLNAGKRLTIAAQSPRDFDLTIVP